MVLVLRRHLYLGHLRRLPPLPLLGPLDQTGGFAGFLRRRPLCTSLESRRTTPLVLLGPPRRLGCPRRSPRRSLLAIPGVAASRSLSQLATFLAATSWGGRAWGSLEPFSTSSWPGTWRTRGSASSIAGSQIAGLVDPIQPSSTSERWTCGRPTTGSRPRISAARRESRPPTSTPSNR